MCCIMCTLLQYTVTIDLDNILILHLCGYLLIKKFLLDKTFAKPRYLCMNIYLVEKIFAKSAIPYFPAIKRMCLYLHRKKTCA